MKNINKMINIIWWRLRWKIRIWRLVPFWSLLILVWYVLLPAIKCTFIIRVLGKLNIVSLCIVLMLSSWGIVTSKGCSIYVGIKSLLPYWLWSKLQILLLSGHLIYNPNTMSAHSTYSLPWVQSSSPTKATMSNCST